MAVSNSIVKSTNAKLGFTDFVTNETVKARIAKTLTGKSGERFISNIISTVSNNPALQECDNRTIVNAALLAESLSLSLSPTLGQAYLVPFNDNRNNRKVAQFQLGYKGYIQLAIRSGQYRRMNVVCVKQGEFISFDPLTEELKIKLIEDEAARETAPTVGYYARLEYVNGFTKAIYWSKEKMETHALTYSKGYKAKKGYTFWEKNFDEMACKTMLRQLISKWGIMSIEQQNMISAMEKDMSVIDDDGKAQYVDNPDYTEPPIVTDYSEVPPPADAPEAEDDPLA